MAEAGDRLLSARLRAEDGLSFTGWQCEAIGAESGAWVDTQRCEDGGSEVFRTDGAVADVCGCFVRGSVDGATGNTGSGQHGGVAVGPVIATDGGSAATDAGGASEFPSHYDEGGVEESAVVKIFEECGHGGVGAGQSPAEAIPAIIEDADPGISVHIPGFDADEAVIGSQSHPGNDADEADSGFDQSASEQQVLSERVSAVAIADVFGFGIDVEGTGGGIALEQCEGAILQFLESSGGGVRCGAGGGVLQQQSAGLKAVCGEFGGRGEGCGAEAWCGGVVGVSFADEQWAAVGAEEAAAEPGGFCGCSATTEFLQPDVGRHIFVSGLQACDDGAECG